MTVPCTSYPSKISSLVSNKGKEGPSPKTHNPAVMARQGYCCHCWTERLCSLENLFALKEIALKKQNGLKKSSEFFTLFSSIKSKNQTWLFCPFPPSFPLSDLKTDSLWWNLPFWMKSLLLKSRRAGGPWWPSFGYYLDSNPLGQRCLITKGICLHHLQSPCSAPSIIHLLLGSRVTLEGTSPGP